MTTTGEAANSEEMIEDSNVKQVVLEDVFELYGSKSIFVYLLLIENHGLLYAKSKSRDELMKYKRTGSNKSINLKNYCDFNQLSWRDIVGCQCMKHYKQATDKAFLCVYAYVLVKKRFGKGRKRQRICLALAVGFHQTFEQNLSVAEEWRDAIRKCLTGLDANGVLGPRRNLLVLVNPHSGQGKALSIFEQKIAPVLTEAGVSFELVTTERQNHAKDLVNQSDLSRWQGIIVVGGDGLLYEVVNGLMNRSDWANSIKIPVGIVPGGSGNGLAAAIHYALGEPSSSNGLLLSAFNVAKGRTIPMDLVRVELPGQTLYSFLCIAWGIIADIDIESERIRSIGETRFTLWAIPRLANLRVYRGRLSYLAAPGYTHSKHQRQPQQQQAARMLSRSVSSYDYRKTKKKIQSSISVDNFRPSEDEDEDFEEDENAATNNASNLIRIKSCETITAEYDAKATTSSSGEEDSYKNLNGVKDTESPSTLPPLDQAVPSSWTQFEEDFVLVCCAYQTHIGNNVLLIPDASLDDGLMWLLIIRKGVSRSQLLQFLLTLETGGHVDYPWVEIIPVTAFRLEPITPGGHLTVDGELVPYGPIQAQILPSITRILTY
ncbi:hypothetical protein CHUAL_003075 [Chamberlinius hualienensis]